ncbi:hypothetical protein KIL84_016931, partial [Mauremys mutica]
QHNTPAFRDSGLSGDTFRSRPDPKTKRPITAGDWDTCILKRGSQSRLPGRGGNVGFRGAFPSLCNPPPPLLLGFSPALTARGPSLWGSKQTGRDRAPYPTGTRGSDRGGSTPSFKPGQLNPVDFRHELKPELPS